VCGKGWTNARSGSFVLDFFFVSFFCIKGKRKKVTEPKRSLPASGTGGETAGKVSELNQHTANYFRIGQAPAERQEKI